MVALGTATMPLTTARESNLRLFVFAAEHLFGNDRFQIFVKKLDLMASMGEHYIWEEQAAAGLSATGASFKTCARLVDLILKVEVRGR